MSRRGLDTKPLVVGITWVVECAEKRERVKETPFLVDLYLENVAGTNKVCRPRPRLCAPAYATSSQQRRRSMVPKNLFDTAGGPSFTPTSVGEGSSSSLAGVHGSRTPPFSLERYASLIKGTIAQSEDGGGDSSLDSDMAPLERARKKRPNLLSMLKQE